MQSSISLSLTKPVRLHSIEHLLPRTSSPVVFVLSLIAAFLCKCFNLTQLIVKNNQPVCFSCSAFFHLTFCPITTPKQPNYSCQASALFEITHALVFFCPGLKEGRFACEVRERGCCSTEVSGGLAEISQGCFALLLLGKICFSPLVNIVEP